MGGSDTVPYEIKGLNEECGVFGVFDTKKANQLTYFGLHSLQHRGQVMVPNSSNSEIRVYWLKSLLMKLIWIV